MFADVFWGVSVRIDRNGFWPFRPLRGFAAFGRSSPTRSWSELVEPGEVDPSGVPNKKAHPLAGWAFLFGTPERIRTSDLCLRRATLYPAELRAQNFLVAVLRFPVRDGLTARGADSGRA